MPSIEQLNEAVLAFMADHPGALITVVVDATFGHRIDKKEVKAFDEAVANNELVTPPAGAIGRGDAFVLQIANKANAGILSNDSFQEFHGEYPWLFDEGRLIGGKPVPHVGWVFVERLPVRGAKSRQSVKQSKGRQRVVKGSGSPLADQPMPVPSAPPPGRAVRVGSQQASEPASTRSAASTPSTVPSATPVKGAKSAGGRAAVNELLPFLDFVERHPVGTSCTVEIESYASHGAYARSGDVLVYLPLRLMGDPVPRSARSAVSIGEAVAVVIAGYVPERRSVDAALPSAVGAHPALAEAVAAVAAVAAKPQKQPRKRVKKASAEPTAGAAEPVLTSEPMLADAALPAAGALPVAEGSQATPKRRRARSSGVTASGEAPAPEPAAQATPEPAVPPVSRRRRKPATSSAIAAPAEAPAPPVAAQSASQAQPTKRSRARAKPPVADAPAASARSRAPRPAAPADAPEAAPSTARKRRRPTTSAS
jgi:hypothetical protein